jgi:hypothetical protein
VVRAQDLGQCCISGHQGYDCSASILRLRGYHLNHIWAKVKMLQTAIKEYPAPRNEKPGPGNLYLALPDSCKELHKKVVIFYIVLFCFA